MSPPFWFDHFLDSRAEFCLIFCSFFGQSIFKKKCFWDLLTFIRNRPKYSYQFHWVHTDSFECCSAKCESYQMDCFAISSKALYEFGCLEGFCKRPNSHHCYFTCILLSYPDSFLRDWVSFIQEFMRKF